VTPLSGSPPLLNWRTCSPCTTALVPVFLACLLAHQAIRPSGGCRDRVFVVAADRPIRWDIARRRGLVTRFGTIADPIADKALMGPR